MLQARSSLRRKQENVSEHSLRHVPSRQQPEVSVCWCEYILSSANKTPWTMFGGAILHKNKLMCVLASLLFINIRHV